MKKTTKGVAVGSVAVCLLACMAGSPKKAESIELSVPFDKTEYDINTEIPVTISASPEGADLDDLEYFSDSDAVTFSDSIIKTGETEGDYSFYVRADDVKSNVLSIHVVDITALNEAARKAEEERLTKEAEEQKTAEEQAVKEVEERVAAEKATQEAAEQKTAEEQAAREAEEKAVAEKAAKEAEKKAAAERVVSESAADLPETESTPEPQPTEVPVQIVEEQVQEVPVSGTAYLSATGSKYHSIDHCGRMNPNKARKTTVSEAEAAGYERCSKCW